MTADIDPRLLALAAGLLPGLLLAAWFWWRWSVATRRHAVEHLHLAEEIAALQASNQALQQRREELRDELESLQGALRAAEHQTQTLERERVGLSTRMEEKERHFEQQLTILREAEQRLAESFQNVASRIFEDRSQKFTEQNKHQVESLLKPMREQLGEFNKTVQDTHKEELKQHSALRERLMQLEQLNVNLEREARDLTRALTTQAKTQGNWGEQQLQRLLEMAGLTRGREFALQYSVTSESGARVQPDVVLFLPEEKTIVMDAKVSLNAWTRYTAAEDAADAERALNEHVAAIRQHINGLSEKRYPEVAELNALDFVLMFIPIEGALTEALNRDPGLAEYALQRRVSLLSGTNLLATLRTVASIWQIHNQNANAQKIASRAGLLYDKFVTFTESLKKIGDRIRQAQTSYDAALGQLSTGHGNLVRQTEMLKELGVSSSKQMDPRLLESAADEPVPDQLASGTSESQASVEDSPPAADADARRGSDEAG